jgi:hypothetical protein
VEGSGRGQIDNIPTFDWRDRKKKTVENFSQAILSPSRHLLFGASEV